MKLVVDANVLFALLLKNGKTMELLIDDTFLLYAPEFLFTEFLKYEELLLERTRRSRAEFDYSLRTFRRRVKLVPLADLAPFVPEATLVSPDAKDIAYFALALKLDAGIWSNDRRLTKQSRVRVWSTKELVELL